MRYFLFFFFIVLNNYAIADFNWSTNCNNAYLKIISLELEDATLLIKKEKKTNPTNKIVHLLDNYIDFFSIQIGEQHSNYLSSNDLESFRIKEIKKGNINSPWYNYCQAEIYIQNAANKLKFNEYLKSAYNLNSAYRLLKQNEEKFPHFIPNQKSLAILETLIGSIPQKYHWILSIINIDGSISLGIKKLEYIVENLESNNDFNHLVTETYFYLSFLKLNLQNTPSELEKLLPKIENSSFLILNYATHRICNKIGRYQQAISILENRIISESSFKFYYLDYLLAKAKLNQLDYDAEIYFKHFLANFKGKNYIKSSLMYLSWIALLQNNMSLFYEYQNKINMMGETFVDADKEAQKQFDKKTKPNKFLLKSRLLFDGGKYRNSLSQLDSITETNKSIKLEILYRKARNHEKLNQFQLAKKYYNDTYDLGNDMNFYFAAKSALQLGLLYENEGFNEKAIEYFNKCINLKNHQYEQGIELKAKSGLNRITN